MRYLMLLLLFAGCASTPSPEGEPAPLAPAPQPSCYEQCEQESSKQAVSAEKIAADCEVKCAPTEPVLSPKP